MRPLFHPASRVAASSARGAASRSRGRFRRTLGVLLALNAILLFLLFRSPMRSPAERQAALERLESQRSLAAEEAGQLRELRDRFQAATRNEQQFAQENFLQRSSAFSQMIENLETLATQNRLRPADTTFRPSQDGNQLGWVNVEASLSLEGEYEDLVRFVNALEQSKLFWIIESLDVSGEPGARLRLNLRTETYLLPL